MFTELEVVFDSVLLNSADLMLTFVSLTLFVMMELDVELVILWSVCTLFAL